MPYAELHAKTNFSFLEGGSHPDELVRRAAELGYHALAITDRASLAGVVRAHVAAKEVGLKLLIGAEITPADAPPLVLWASDRAAYGRLARLITRGRRRAEKGECHLTFQDVAEHAEGLIAGVIGKAESRKPKAGEPEDCELQVANCKLKIEDGEHVDQDGSPGPQAAFRSPLSAFPEPWLLTPDCLHGYRDVFGDRLYLLAELHRGPDDGRRLERLVELGRRARVPLAAAGDVHYHVPERRALCDVLTAIRHGLTVAGAGEHLFANAERHLRPPEEIAAAFARAPDAVRRTVEIADRCTFSLDELRYEYPEELAPRGEKPIEHLRRLTWAGAKKRYPCGVPDKVRRLLEHELRLIEELRYEAYFLTVWDLVRFARRRGILCQGRGSAANSAVCYCLGVTAVDPERMDVLFERFVSRERNEAPDIDVDFEHERREEVLQYLYRKYGRDRAGMTAEVITYRPRSATRDVGKALGLSLDRVDKLAKRIEQFHEEPELGQRCREAGIDPDTTLGRQLVELVGQLVGFPRHLSQHTGGMVITQGPLCELVPIENAAMRDRTVIQWNKDDLDELGVLKVDCLALGMLTAIHKCFGLVEKHYGRRLSLAGIPPDDAEVYAMIRRADTMGVFQIESRAQMSMLPRLRPRCFYDLVIEVAIVRPGPIQGNMVHPYLRRRNGEEPVTYPNEAIRKVLQKTLGVPLFQEQAMRLAVVAAGFTPGEADQLRRAMGAWRRPGLIDRFRRKLIDGMLATGMSREYAEATFQQIRGFGAYGFPESHAASFALLVYVSAWLKHHYQAAFTAALLNSQPMGFYAPAQLVRNARQHGVEVRPVDVNYSDWESTLEAKRKAESGKRRAAGGGQQAAGSGERAEGNRVGFARPPMARRNESAIRDVGQISESAGKRGHKRQVGKPAPRCTFFQTSHIEPLAPDPENRDPEPQTPNPHFPLPASRFPLSASRSPLSPFGLRLGFHMLHGMSSGDAERIAEARGNRPFGSLEDFARRTGLGRSVAVRLAKAGAFESLGLDRRGALWHALAQDEKKLPLFEQKGSGFKVRGSEAVDRQSSSLQEPGADDSVGNAYPTVNLPNMSPAEEVLADYRTTGLSLKAHPLTFLREHLARLGVAPAEQLKTLPNGGPVRVAGIVLVRQRPGTAKGITFVTLEDETGTANLIIRPDVWKRYRTAAQGATILLAHGRLQRQGLVIHVLVSKLENLSDRLKNLESGSRDFC